jgi:hypothetical protein
MKEPCRHLSLFAWLFLYHCGMTAKIDCDPEGSVS